MKKIIVVLLVITVFAIFMQENTKNNNNVFAQSAPSEVFILMCVAETNQTSSRRIIVNASGGRNISRGTDCSSALEGQLRVGFTIQNVQPAFNPTGVFYTLTR